MGEWLYIALEREGRVYGNAQVNRDLGNITPKANDAAQLHKTNTFYLPMALESGGFGGGNPAIVIRAMTGSNPYARPAIKMDNNGTTSATLIYDTDKKLKIDIDGTMYVIQMTKQ